MTDNVSANMQSQVLAVMAGQLRLGKTNMASVAQALKISEATLRRRLLSEETSFSRLLEQARFELAKRYLADRTLNLDDVANLMGCRTVAELDVLFDKWSGGVAVAEYRDAVLEAARTVLESSQLLRTDGATRASSESAATREPKAAIDEPRARESWV